MATVVVDAVAALRAYLLTVTPITALVGARVYGGGLPAAEASLMPRAAITLKAAGGISGRGYNPLRRQRIDVRCYGVTATGAQAVYLAVYQAMKYAARPTAALINAIEESGAIALEDPDTRWPLVLSVWQVTAYDSEEV